MLDGTPFVGRIALEVEVLGFPHGTQALKVVNVEGHIGAQDQPCHDFLGLRLILGRRDKIQIWVFLKDPPKMPQMHVLEHRLILAIDRQLRLGPHLEGISRAIVVQIVAEASRNDVEIFLIRHDVLQGVLSAEALVHQLRYE